MIGSCMAESCAAASAGTPAGQIFIHLVQTLLSAQCALADNSANPPDRTSAVLENPEFDFIVVGGGTAGSVVASRLSENRDWNVLLIERGTDSSVASKIPSMVLLLQGTAEDYSYKVEPDSRYCQGMKNKRCVWAKGKGLGGSSLINAMLHVHGNEKDYDTWATLGNTGWSYGEILQYFRKSENYHPEVAAKHGRQYFGVGGPLNIRDFNYTFSPLAEIISSAGEELGYPRVEEFNGEDNIGFGKVKGACDQGIRQDAARAFLSRAKDRENLFVMKKTRADSIIIKNKKAVGVRVTLEDGNKLELRATKEVILSTGSIVSPQILMLSGIGPKKHLKEMGIKTLVDLPVGENLQDHAIMFNLQLAYPNDTRTPPTPTMMLDMGYQYLVHKNGLLASTGGIDFVGFLNVDDPNSKYPNVEYHFVFVPKGDPFLIDAVANAFAINDDLKAKMYEINKDFDSILVGPVILNPESVGRVQLRSNDPADTVKIYANYFDREKDIDVMIKGLEVLKKMENTKTFKKYNIKIKWLEIEGCEDSNSGSVEYLKCAMRHMATTIYHPVGTAKMGPVGDKTAVVDPKLKVHGIERLRVIDASVMPTITSGNTNSPTMMIAEKGSDLVKQDWMKKDEL